MSHGGKRPGAGRPKGGKTYLYRLPVELGRWLKQSPKVIEVLKSDEVQRQIEEIADASVKSGRVY